MCGIFASYNTRKASELTAIGLHGLQHRAIDFAGIVSTDGANPYRYTGPGIARQVFTKERLDTLRGRSALGHIRYPTVADEANRDNTQPIIGSFGGSWFALAHNGNLTNLADLKAQLSGRPMATSMDTEYVVRLLSTSRKPLLIQALGEVLPLLEGAWSLALLTPDSLILARDRSGVRPLMYARRGESIFAASETCAFDAVDASDPVEVKPGEIIVFAPTGTLTVELQRQCRAFCRFESVYFAHPASVVFGESVADFRLALGRKLGELFPSPGCDYVTPVPDSSTLIAMGYAERGQSGPYFPLMVRNHYVGRTFIAANQALRDAAVVQKFTFVREKIRGARVTVVDDSIVRLTTLTSIVGRLRAAGAREVHARIGFPPVAHPCLYGINTPTYEELAAHQHSPDEICRISGADSLEYMTLKGLRSLAKRPDDFCYACIDGNYWHKGWRTRDGVPTIHHAP